LALDSYREGKANALGIHRLDFLVLLGQAKSTGRMLIDTILLLVISRQKYISDYKCTNVEVRKSSTFTTYKKSIVQSTFKRQSRW